VACTILFKARAEPARAVLVRAHPGAIAPNHTIAVPINAMVVRK
jgi:hypothetical protein